MFDLEHSIAEWRRQMRAAGIKAPTPLDELESHLRDDVEQQMQPGVTAQQAFEAAVHRIGQATTLKAEFEKTGEIKRGWQLMSIKLIIVTGGSGLVCIIVGSLRHWAILKVAAAFARAVPGTSDFYAAADRSLAQSVLMLCFGVALLLASGILYFVSRRRKPPLCLE
ncbi:MAG: permease prefix domain 1-containing protein [Verrucomicrobiota bacterium]